MPFEWFVALRFLWDQKAQSALIVSGVGLGVGVMVFISALISGLQDDLIARTLGTQAHVVVSPREEEARPLQDATAEPERVLARRIDKPAQRIRSISEWQSVEREIGRVPGVVATAPLVTGPAFLVRGNASEAVTLFGVEPEQFERLIPVTPAMTLGRFSVEGTGIVLGSGLAATLGVSLGDKVRIDAGDGRTELFAVRGIFDLGSRQVNERWALVSLRSGQTLLGLPGGASTLYVDVEEIYSASDVAVRIQESTGLVVESWMQTNAQLLTALRSQSASSMMIRFFVMLSVAIGITSVLVVSVVQRSREIGILRAMGASRARVLRAFLIQGALIGLSGSILGSAFGGMLAWAFPRLAAGPTGTPLFPVSPSPWLFVSAAGIALGTGILAAVFPARRAARLHPAAAIRHV